MKAIVAEKWETHLETHPEDASKICPPLPFRNKVIRDLYGSETQEIKDEVERRRDEVVSDNELADVDDGEDVNEEESQRRAKAAGYQK